MKHSLSTDYEIAIVCHKGKCPIRGKRDGSVWEVTKMNPNKMQHPTQKPTELIERLIEKFSDEGDIVLDQFLGSGTTAVAAVNTNRHYIGFEVDETYFDVTIQRLDEAEGKEGELDEARQRRRTQGTVSKEQKDHHGNSRYMWNMRQASG